MRKILIIALKIVVPLAVVGWLLYQTPPEQLEQLRAMNKRWDLLWLSLLLALAALVNTFARWYLLVRSLRLPFRVGDALRLGFLGYLLNFVSVGVVGGDLFKAIFIAREQPRRRPEAVASVIVDRVIGLYALLLVASAAYWSLDAGAITPEVRAIGRATLITTLVGAAGVALLMLPGFTTGPLAEAVAKLPGIGSIGARMMGAVRMYRRRPLVLLTALLQSIVTHLLFAGSIYCIAAGLFPTIPTVGEHLIVVPLSMVFGSLPFTPAGLGTLELAMAKLYEIIPAEPHAVSGVVVALAFRLVQIALAAIGIGYYWSSKADWERIRREAAEMREAEQEAEAELATPALNDSP